MARGRSTGLNSSVLCTFRSCHCGIEKPPQATAALWGEHGSAHSIRIRGMQRGRQPTPLPSAQFSTQQPARRVLLQ